MFLISSIQPAIPALLASSTPHFSLMLPSDALDTPCLHSRITPSDVSPPVVVRHPCQHGDIRTYPLLFFFPTHSHSQLFLTSARLRQQDRNLNLTCRSTRHLPVKERAASPSGHALQVSFWTPRTSTSSAQAGPCSP